ncbi:MAG: hypothetical protein ACREVW_05495, partial [Burkholderiales bacterium]
KRGLTVHAHALAQDEADLFREEVAAPGVGTVRLLEFKGVLLSNAIVRTKPARDGLHSVPVVCMDLKSAGDAITHTCRAELPFTDATRKQAEDLAKTLTKGRAVTVFTPVTDMRLVFPHVNSISLN